MKQVTTVLMSIFLTHCTLFKSEEIQRGPQESAFGATSESYYDEPVRDEILGVVNDEFRVAKAELELYSHLSDNEPACIIPEGSILGFSNESLTYKDRRDDADLYHNPFISLICGDIKQGWIRYSNGDIAEDVELVRDTELYNEAQAKGWDRIEALQYF